MKISTIRPPGWHENGTSPQPMLIEMTSKRWKGLLLLSFVTGVLGVILVSWLIWADVYRPLLLGGFNADASSLTRFSEIFSGFAGILGLVLLLASVALGGFDRLMAWWHHG